VAAPLAAYRVSASGAELVADKNDETAAGSAAAPAPQPRRVSGRFRWPWRAFSSKNGLYYVRDASARS
jgi:hypothetical protein